MSTLNTYNLKSPDSANTNIELDASGNIAVRAGSAASPSIYVTGDSNTGIYSPGADQVAISTGGSGRLFVDASGRIGIGASSPGVPLDITTVNATANLRITDSTNGAKIKLVAASTEFDLFNTGGAGWLGTATNSPLLLATNGTEKLRITSAGLVGVGTSSPAQILHCTTTNGTASQLQFTQQFQREYRLGIPASSTSFEIYDVSASANRLTIDSSGRLGVSETAPGTFDVRDAKITLTDSTSDGIGIKGRKDSLDRWYVGYNSSDHLEINQIRNNTLAFKTNNTEVARLTNSGQLLVGTSSSPTSGDSQYARLRVQGNTLNTEGFIAIARDEAASGITSGEVIGQIFYTDSAGNAFGVIKCEADANAGTNDYPGRLVFSTTADGAASPTERMRIFAEGSIRISNAAFLYPATDNVVSLGASGQRFSAVWAANGTIQTSDQRAKADITTATLGAEFIKALRPVSYKWIEGGKRDTGERDADNNYIYESVPGERTHWGFIAQEVKQAVDAAGVDFGGWVLTDKDDPDSQQALRYDQFIAPLTKALQEALAEIDVLKAKVAALENA